MPDNEEVKNEEVQNEQPPVQSEENKQESVVDDRPERNWKAELERKNREIEKLRQEREALEHSTVQKRDQNDLSTWSDHELKAIAKSNDPSVMPYKEQAEDVLLERKVRNIRERERMQEKRALTELELRTKYPDANDPGSELSLKIEQVMYDYDLQKSPAGRLAAAKIAASELGMTTSKSKAKERDSETRRVADVKSKMVDGDRSKPPQDQVVVKDENLKGMNSKNIEQSASHFGEVLKGIGLTRDSFFKK